MIDLLDGKAIYAKIDGLRQKRSWTIYELAKKAGVATTTLYNWRDRGSSPTLSLLDALCSALGISVLEFLTDEEEIIALNKELQELIAIWGTLSCEQKKYFLGLMKSINK